MKKSMLKMNVSDFIEQRLLESYIRVSQSKEYKEKKAQYVEQEEYFNSKLYENELLEDYEDIKDKKLYLDSLELEEAYKIGFKDSIKLLQEKE